MHGAMLGADSCCRNCIMIIKETEGAWCKKYKNVPLNVFNLATIHTCEGYWHGTTYFNNGNS